LSNRLLVLKFILWYNYHDNGWVTNEMRDKILTFLFLVDRLKGQQFNQSSH